ncbi:hypothetical protein [Staphylococcus pettenkoferi]|nr:hypothetical protein [Staphylococcus pettenkoferi]
MISELSGNKIMGEEEIEIVFKGKGMKNVVGGVVVDVFVLGRCGM